MELVVISAPDAIDKEAQTINLLFEAGLKRLHLRKPGWDSKQVTALLIQIDKVFHAGIALHQHHQIAGDFDIKRLHYTEKYRIETDIEKMVSQNQQDYVLSTSVHDLTELASLKSFEYVFFGPVFNSISKLGYHSKLPEGFRVNKEDIKTKVIAIGGIEASNLNKVKEMNFDGAAVLGTIWNEPENAVRNFKNLLQG